MSAGDDEKAVIKPKVSKTPLLDEFLRPGKVWYGVDFARDSDPVPKFQPVSKFQQELEYVKAQMQLHCGMTPDMMREVGAAEALKPPYLYEKKLLLTV